MWFDSHCHVSAIAQDWRAERVAGGLAVGVDVDDWSVTKERLQELSGRWRQAIGFHPWVARDDLPWQELAHWLCADVLLAVGEIGLDGSPLRRDNAQAQLSAFKRQVILAAENNRVMSLHVVHDDEQCYQIIRRQKGVRGIVHGFTGSLEQGLRWQDLGFYLGIGFRVLNSLSDKRISMLKRLDLTRVLLETDAPYCIAQDKILTPNDIPDLGSQLASVLDISGGEIERQCQKNWLRLWSE
jgi:TatD DNase family protein